MAARCASHARSGGHQGHKRRRSTRIDPSTARAPASSARPRAWHGPTHRPPSASRALEPLAERCRTPRRQPCACPRSMWRRHVIQQQP
eukprot:4288675-Pyramimonas_sp.AAC.1